MIRNLPELCNIQYGYAFDSASFTDDASYMPLVRIRDVKRGYSETYYSGAYSDEYIIRAGDLLVGMDGEFNIAKWKSLDALLNQRVCKITAKKETDGEYLRFALSVALKIIEERTAFVTVKHLSAKELNKIKIQAPSYEEQKNIAGILSRIEKIIQAKQDELRKLDNLIKARFVEMFGENDATSKVLIGDAVELINGRAFKPTDWTPTGLPIIRIQNLNDTKAPYNYFYGAYDKKNYIKSGELLFSWSGTPGTSFGAFIWNRGPGLLNQHIFRVLPKKDYDLNFLRFALNAQLDEIISKAHGGVGLQHITKSELEKIAIPYPNRKLQAAFSAFVAQIDKSKFALSNELAMGNFYIRLIYDCIMHSCIDL